MDVVIVGKHTEVDGALRSLTQEKLERISKFATDGAAPMSISRSTHPPGRRLAYLRDPRARQPSSREGTAGRGHRSRRAAPTRSSTRCDGSTNGAPTAQRTRERACRRRGSGGRRRRASDDAGPAIVKTKAFEVKPMSPEEAALQMELLGHDFFVFRSTENDRAAVLYRRRDGALGLIEVTG
jgi:putative sigma-54 modulation protein